MNSAILKMNTKNEQIQPIEGLQNLSFPYLRDINIQPLRG